MNSMNRSAFLKIELLDPNCSFRRRLFRRLGAELVIERSVAHKAVPFNERR
jgi:hypothetical protein